MDGCNIVWNNKIEKVKESLVTLGVKCVIQQNMSPS